VLVGSRSLADLIGKYGNGQGRRSTPVVSGRFQTEVNYVCSRDIV
jgi:hypothetical protein